MWAKLAALVIVGLATNLSAKTAMVEMLNLTGARQAAMGETAPLFDPDPFNLEYNPAAIVGLNKGRVGFSHNQFIQSRNTSTLAAIFPVRGVDCGIHVRLSNLGDIEVRDSPSTEPDYIAGAHDFALKVFSAYRPVDKFQVGVSLGWLMEKIDIDRASVPTFGMGALYYVLPDLAVHASITNVGGKVTFRSEKNDPPTIYRAGAGYRWRDLSVSADYVNVKSGDGHVHVGGEYLLEKLMFLRAGYQTGYDSRNISAGAGFLYQDFRIDYAFVPYQSDLGNSHRFTLVYSFN